MHTIVVASNLGIVRTGLIQLVRERVGACRIVEADSIAELTDTLQAGHFQLLMADFSYIYSEDEDMQWVATLRVKQPKIPILLFLGEQAGNSIVHMISDALICIGRGATVADLRNCLDFFLGKTEKTVLPEDKRQLPKTLECC